MKLLRSSAQRLFSFKNVDIKFHQDCRLAIFKGITKLNDAVKITLGPKGNNVALEYELGPPKITKDGVTVAKHIEFLNAWEDVGAKIIKFPAHESNIHAGDGTTTATILTNHILAEGLKQLEKGYHPVLVKEGLVKAAEIVDKYLLEKSIPVTSESELNSICNIACNNDKKMADLILHGILTTGRDGAFLVEEGNSLEDRLTVTLTKITDGFVIPRGFASEMFSLTESELKLENPLILVGSYKFRELSPILSILEYAKKNNRSLIIAGEDVDQEVLNTLLLNKEKAELDCCAINFPGENNYMFLEDLAGFTGARLINPHTIQDLSPKDLGSCGRVNIDSMKSTFIQGQGDLSIRKAQIRNEMAEETDNMALGVQKERLQRLSGKMAVFEIGLLGGKIAMAERRDRIIDSLNSVKTAAKEGFLPGGGIALNNASKILSQIRYNNEHDIGIRILQEALKIPLTLIAKTSSLGISSIDTIWASQDEEYGIDANKGIYCNMVDNGIIDSTGVVRQAVRTAVSVSQMILATSAVIVKTKRYVPTKLKNYKKEFF